MKAEKLIKIYEKKYRNAAPVALRYDTKIIDSQTIVSTLVRGSPPLVALQAVQMEDLLRMTSLSPIPTRYPLEDLTNGTQHTKLTNGDGKPAPNILQSDPTLTVSTTSTAPSSTAPPALSASLSLPSVKVPAPNLVNEVAPGVETRKPESTPFGATSTGVQVVVPCRPSTEPDYAQAVTEAAGQQSIDAASDQPDSNRVQPKEETDELPKSLEVMIQEEDFHIEEDALKDLQTEPSRMTMSELFDGRTPEQLEESVERGIELLAGLKKTVESQPSKGTAQWLKAIHDVQSQAVRSKTIVGVVGATGAGKSSVINAMLDEDRLLPTNCMRACTAVVTEISWHDMDGYRAEIEFISRADWQKMLRVLFQDLLDPSGAISKEINNEDTEAGVAYAQIRAVYPNLTKDEMTRTTVEYLMAHDNVSCLGGTRKIGSKDPLIFYNQLQFFVDSKEKNSGKKDNEKEKKVSKEHEYWPLIRVVRIYVKAHALSTGAVIVDLPGVQDSNQARAAVAQQYMQNCSALWIVAPITRAVDDKSAKTLMGQAFKRQLKMDGGFSDVTFICSKSDDISIIEASDSLGLEGELAPLWTQSEELQSRRADLISRINDYKGARAETSAAMDIADEEAEAWEELSERLEQGETAYEPEEKPQKRKRRGERERPLKRTKYSKHDSADSSLQGAISDADSDADSDDGSVILLGQRQALSEQAVATKLAELRATKKDGRQTRVRLDEQIKSTRREVAVVDEEIKTIEDIVFAKCISGRNDYSREAIRQDYAAGVREIDQELAELDDAENFNPDDDARDYDEVAKNLPVFCVSSRAYQKLQGRLVKDRRPAGFRSIAETEVPLLQDHCIQLTTKSRQTSCRRFLTSLFHILNSLRLLAMNDGTGRKLTELQLAKEEQILKEKLKKLDEKLETTVETLIKAVASDINDKIYDLLPAAVEAAKTKAEDAVGKWEGHRDAGGLAYATYKAVCRRDGVFTNARGPHNFNADLLEPLMQRLSGPWETIFTRRLPRSFGSLPDNVSRILTTFHSDQEKQATRDGVSLASFHMLRQQIPVYKETLVTIISDARTLITEKQREVNRVFEPRLTESMKATYAQCVAEHGQGSYMRMRAIMSDYIDQQKQAIFSDCVNHVRGLIKKLLNEVKEMLLTRMDGIYVAVEREYSSVVVGQQATAGGLPREERIMRKALLEILNGAEMMFKRAVGLEPEDELMVEKEIGSDHAAAQVVDMDDTSDAMEIMKTEA